MTTFTDALERIEATTDTGDFGAGMLNAAALIRDALAHEPIFPPAARVFLSPPELRVVFVPDDAATVYITRELLLELLALKAEKMDLTLTVVTSA